MRTDGWGGPRTYVVSRLRRDAALFDLPPPRQPGQRDRPRKKGDRLPKAERRFVRKYAEPGPWDKPTNRRRCICFEQRTAG